MMDPIKEAFLRAKQDIQELKIQIETLIKEVESLKSLKNPTDSSKIQQTDRQTNISTDNPTQTPYNPTSQQTNPTNEGSFNNSPTDNYHFKGLKDQNIDVSNGNRGVPTNRQTNQQTDRQQTNRYFIDDRSAIDQIPNVSQLIDSLDSIKREVRIKFKKLTNQEMMVFATIYQLEESEEYIDYPLISRKLNLSESSIRDYIQRIIKKGIPLVKSKENNKKVYISVSKDLRKIVSLSTILQLREL